MSAINEWFGYYNAIFHFINDTYGENELNHYLNEIADTANQDISQAYILGGLESVKERYIRNFTTDGDMDSVEAELGGDVLQMKVRCPAYFNSPKEDVPQKQVGPFFCECCKKLNGRILANSDFILNIELIGSGTCRWNIEQKL